MSLALPLSTIEDAANITVCDANGKALVLIPHGAGALDIELARQTARGLTRSTITPRSIPRHERPDYRAAIKNCVMELHIEAARMNESRARNLLNGAAGDIEAFPPQLPPHLSNAINPEVLFEHAINLRLQNGIPLCPEG